MKELLDSIFLSLKYSTKDIIVFPGDNLDEVLKLSSVISTISTISHFSGLPTLLDWRGCWVGCALVFIITLIGRREKDEISRSNGVSTVSARTDGVGKPSTSTERETDRIEDNSSAID